MDAEQAVLGFDHTLIGALVAQNWKLPKPVIDAIKNHHALPTTATPLSELIHVSDIICRGLDIGHGGDDLIPSLNASVLSRLGLNWEIIRNCLGEIENLNRFTDQLINSAS